MSLDQFSQRMLPALEEELKAAVSQADGSEFGELQDILAYHMGWQGEGAGPAARGKRIRPLMLLLTSAAAGGEWEEALPAGAAVELIHNFSLLHDDIEDNSPVRRGRPTVWKKWGVPQAINAGDAMFTIAHLAMARLSENFPVPITLQAMSILQRTCLHLTQGQYLDIAYEIQGDLTLEAYWPMVEGKTASLIAACTEIGALVAGADEPTRQNYKAFGRYIGLAFQVQDDFLGIWGQSAVTGKSTQSDLLSGKKSLPVLYALNQKGLFAKRWVSGSIQPEEVSELAHQMVIEGAYDYTQETSGCLTDKALDELQTAAPQGDAGEALGQLAHMLLNRQG